jgi:hypothetical protein
MHVWFNQALSLRELERHLIGRGWSLGTHHDLSREGVSGLKSSAETGVYWNT